MSKVQCKHYEIIGTTESNCIEGHCKCTKVDGGEEIPCRPKYSKLNNIIGGPCPCHQANTKCDPEESICYCETGFVANADRRVCLASK